ncbi:hypothetical protein Z052_01865 [Halorubrum sp. C191]|uniref:hypothetical protein n=1 Tax=Halorubrum sp. C191 TaxID=1383842 RepID=UPI000C07C692|nr:hypothetical protein [Halorubrum sp. C191]PHQ43909.1 hypothetical protein Z052_01865 [Halorubrum sp. C191]
MSGPDPSAWGPTPETRSDGGEMVNRSPASDTTWSADGTEDDGVSSTDDAVTSAGSVESVLRRGRYTFMPVFGFSIARIAAQRYGSRRDIDTGLPSTEADHDYLLDGHEMSWWESDSVMPAHPFALVNPAGGIGGVDLSEHDFRDVFRFERGEQFIFADSGGFQLVTIDDAEMVDDPADHDFNEYRINPERLVEWQVRNADAGSTIDFPPYGNTEGTQNFAAQDEFTREWESQFYDHAVRHREMVERMGHRLQELRDDGADGAAGYLFAPVIQARPHPRADDSHKLAREWWKRAVDGAADAGLQKPRAWTLSPKPATSIGQVAYHLAFAAEYLDDAEYIHVLQVSGEQQLPLLMYYASRTDQMVTSDSTAHTYGAKARRFELPRTARRRFTVLSTRDEEENEYLSPTELDFFPCRCPVCTRTQRDRGFDAIASGETSLDSTPIVLHNLQQILDMNRTFDAMLREDESNVTIGGEPVGTEFWRLLDSFFDEKTLRDLHTALEYVATAFDDGLDAANRRYRVLWNSSGGRTIVPASDSASSTSW